MTNWLVVDLFIVILYGLQHSLLTTKTAVNIHNKILPDYTWNLVYSITSVLTIILAFHFWVPSGIYIFRLIPGSFPYHISVSLLSLSLFFFFFCFKFTTSFWQWLGIVQVANKISGKKSQVYYRLRNQGIKKYIRFPHHTCLIFFFWLHPVMTLDTLFLAISATIYLYVGTYHQDLRGLRIIGKEWEDYRKETSLLFPSLKVWKRFFADIRLAASAKSEGANV
ncbi:hypothetical protein ACVTTK_17680 [Alcaligenes nematophilus]